jgi:hypothetical protein
MAVLLGVKDRAEVRSADSTDGWRPLMIFMSVLDRQLWDDKSSWQSLRL